MPKRSTTHSPKHITGRLSFSLLILVLLAFLFTSQKTLAAPPPTKISFQRIFDKYNVSVGAVEAIVQDRQGYIWFGGENGLLRYDGYELRIMDQKDSTGQPIKNIFFLFVDSRGILWVSTSNGLLRYYPEQEHFVRYNNTGSSNLKLAHINTKHMAELPSGELLLATRGGLTIIDVTNEATQILKHQADNDNSLLSDNLWAVAVDAKGNVWVGGDKGVDGINWPTRKFTHYLTKLGSDTGLTHEQILSIAADNLGRIWIGTAQGLNRLNPESQKITQYRTDPNDLTSISANGIRRIYQDSKGTVWIATDQGGLNAYDQKTNQFKRYQSVIGAPDSLSSNVVRSIFEDKIGDLWFGNYPNGVNYFDRSTAASKIYTANPEDPNSLSNNTIMSISADSNNGFWLGTLAEGLTYFDRTREIFKHYKSDPNNPNSLSTNAGIRTYVDSKGVLWVGTWGGGLNKFDSQSEQFIRYRKVDASVPGISKSNNLNSANVRVIKEDNAGNLWLGTQGGSLNKLNRQTGEFTHYMPEPNNDKAILHEIIYALLEDSRGRFWVGTQASLELMDRDNETFTHFVKKGNDETSLSNETIYSLYEDSKKRLWIGTAEGLNLFNEETKTFRHFGKSEGFHDYVIRSIIQGNDGNLWIGTGNGISSFNPDTFEIKNYYNNNAWQKGNFNVGAVARGKDGELYFGGDNGLTLLDLTEFHTNPIVPPISVIDFKLFTDSIKVGGEDALLANAIDHTKKITLNHRQSMFSFEFSALNFRDPSKNEYAYRLQGFDEEWRYVGARRYATFTNIDPGTYVFQVKASNNDGVWNNEGVSINLHILPPWWKTWWAYSLYVCGFFGVLLWIFLHQLYKRTLVEQQNKKLIALDKLKDDFIANTSHELRTPLNGIIGLADSLLAGAAGDINQLMEMNLRMISTSGKRLVSLVNDILDFSKLKNKNLHINARPINLYETSKVVLEMCDSMIKDSNLSVVNCISPNVNTVLADEERLQQILYNLIGNAIKFTHSGSVTLEAERKENWLWVKIIDTGIGIPSGSLEKIFNSFEQLEDHRDRSYSGTGLGLAVTKQLVEAHGGEIIVTSKEGVGSCFSFCIPTTELAAEPSNLQKAAGDQAVSKIFDFAQKSGVPVRVDSHELNIRMPLASNRTIEAQQENQGNSQYKILIVDDNPINRQVLINQLALQEYRFEVAHDGPTALNIIENDGSFDLILLDIMMPQMSGYEVCEKLRQKYPMEELPIIFLTAKNTIADLVSGFEVGANDFLTKPISVGELNSRVKTHLQLLNINRRLEEIVKQRTYELTLAHREIKILDEIVSIINHEIRMDRLLSVILKETASLFPGANYVGYWKLDERKNAFNLTYLDESGRTKESSEAVSRNELETLFITHARKVDVGNYLITDLKLSEDEKILFGVPDTASGLVMAFHELELITSLLVLGATRDTASFRPAQTAIFRRLRNHVDSALTKAKLLERLEQQCIDLEQASLTDSLTGLKNRRFLTKYIDNDISLLQRKYFSRTPDSAIQTAPKEDDFIFYLMDIDDFKKINDIYGHATGDRVLADIQKILEPIFRTSDYRIRWGGEEFLIVARFCDRAHAEAKAEQLRFAMENHSFALADGEPIRLTCSIGFACYPLSKSAPKAFSWTQVISLADLALYAVKNSQKNGWLGLNLTTEDINSDTFKSIVENPESAVADAKITALTNIAQIKWN